jgi:putative endonuclease
MSIDHNQLGDAGEQLAAELLTGKGLSVAESNYSRKWGEIDLVAVTTDSEVVFVEVKTVRCRVPEQVPEEGQNMHRPEEKVGEEKRRRLRRVIQTYLDESATGQPHWRVDLICVYIDDVRSRVNLNWLKNIII